MKPSPEVTRLAQESLLATLTRIDLLEDEKSETSKAFRAVIDEEWARVRTMRGVLEGRISEQLALAGLEEKPADRHRQIGQILRAAVASLERITGVEAGVEDFAGPQDETREVLAAAKVVAEHVESVTLTPGSRRAIDRNIKREKDRT